MGQGRQPQPHAPWQLMVYGLMLVRVRLCRPTFFSPKTCNVIGSCSKVPHAADAAAAAAKRCPPCRPPDLRVVFPPPSAPWA